jgi:predicted SAM-dependent methyltransferase
MKVHLGCGMNYITGWINIDLDSSQADIKADLRLPLPYADSSVDLIFNEHFIEHISREDGRKFLAECYRVLKPGGVLRVSTPDLRWLVAQYIGGKLDEWTDVGWLPRTSCELINEGMRSWGHLYLYDLPELNLAMRSVGFVEITQVAHRESSVPGLGGLECRPWHQELIIEARR